MAERNENSVLTSLGALRQIEEDRLDGEEQQRKHKEEAARRAREDAERLARERQAAEQRAAEEAVRAAEEAARREAREAQLRLAEAEQTARIEAEARLEAERMRLDLETGADAARRPRWVLPSIVGVAVLLTAGLGYLFGVHLPDRQKRQQAASQKRIEEMQARAEAERKALLLRLDKQATALQSAIASATTNDELKRLKSRLKALQEQQVKAQTGAKNGRGRRTRWVRRSTRRAPMGKPPTKPDPSLRNNPLRDLFQ
ncbi:MAG: hypothetical protein ABI333_30090 [bacterium]